MAGIIRARIRQQLLLLELGSDTVSLQSCRQLLSLLQGQEPSRDEMVRTGKAFTAIAQGRWLQDKESPEAREARQLALQGLALLDSSQSWFSWLLPAWEHGDFTLLECATFALENVEIKPAGREAILSLLPGLETLATDERSARQWRFGRAAWLSKLCPEDAWPALMRSLGECSGSRLERLLRCMERLPLPEDALSLYEILERSVTVIEATERQVPACTRTLLRLLVRCDRVAAADLLLEKVDSGAGRLGAFAMEVLHELALEGRMPKAQSEALEQMCVLLLEERSRPRPEGGAFQAEDVLFPEEKRSEGWGDDGSALVNTLVLLKGPEALPPLLSALHSPAQDLQLQACQALLVLSAQDQVPIALRDQVAQGMRDLLPNEGRFHHYSDWEDRITASALHGLIALQVEDLLELLLEHAGSESDRVRARCCAGLRSLAASGRLPEEQVPAVRKALEKALVHIYTESDEEVRELLSLSVDEALSMLGERKIS